MNNPAPRFPVFFSVMALRDFARRFDMCPPVTVDMCLLDCEPFQRGWVCRLVDHEILEYDIRGIRRAIDQMLDTSSYVFRLCVFENDVLDYPPFQPGMRVVYDIPNVSFYGNGCFGSVIVNHA